MVKRIVFLLLLLSLSFLYIAGNISAEWRVLYPLYPPVSGYGLEVHDLENGRFFITMRQGGFLTMDNGASWRFIDMKLGDHRERDIKAFFLNPEKGWAWNGKELSFSSDGGLNWEMISTPPKDQSITKIVFLDEKIGFMDKARTEDGGRHWSNISTLPSLGTKIWFEGPNEGYIIANNIVYKTENAGADWRKLFIGEKVIIDAFFYGENGLIIEKFGDTYITGDGGKTWAEGDIPDYSDPVSFQINEKGQGIGIGSRCFLYSTNDWGRNWIAKDLHPVFKECNKDATKRMLWDGKSMDRFAVLWLKEIFQTTDSGRTWKRNEIPPGSSWIDKDRRIIVSTQPNGISYSDDYGNSWKSLTSVKEKIVNIFINDGKNWTSGNLITTDAGKTWKKSPRICNGIALNFDEHYFGKGMNLSKVEIGLTNGCEKNLAEYRISGLYLFPDKTIVVDDNGIVSEWDDKENKFKSIGNILNLKNIKAEKIEELGPIYFGSKDCACAFGVKIPEPNKLEGDIENGIFCTDDGGNNWHKSKVEKADNEGLEIPLFSDEKFEEIERKILSAARRLKGIMKAGFYLEDCTDGWGIVGTVAKNRYIIKTSNGGKNWSIVSRLNDIELKPTRNSLSIAFLNRQTGWLSDGDNLYKTTDGGINWEREILPVKSIEISRMVVDEGKIYLQTRNGFILMNNGKD